MTIYVIEPDEISPVSRFGSWLKETHHTIVKLSMPDHAEQLATLVAALEHGDTSDIAGVIHCGGRQNAYSENQHPWIAHSKRLYELCVEHDIPALGICLGHQILAVTFGGTVELDSDDHGEEGTVTLELTDNGAADPQLSRLAAIEGPITAYESHNDYVSVIPEGATLLARSARCPVEAFRYKSTVGIQFHPEATTAEIDTWIESEYDKNLWEEKKQQALNAQDALLTTGRAVFDGFVERVTTRIKNTTID